MRSVLAPLLVFALGVAYCVCTVCLWDYSGRPASTLVAPGVVRLTWPSGARVDLERPPEGGAPYTVEFGGVEYAVSRDGAVSEFDGWRWEDVK